MQTLASPGIRGIACVFTKSGGNRRNFYNWTYYRLWICG